MPLINGMKMACEPCIRGHRSTKCTHANERLMVPVRKPGRPLSVCPHPPQQACGCGSVTAAIPRKQTCHCGKNSHTHSAAAHNGAPVPGKSRSSSFDRAGGLPMPPEAPSPTKVAFKVQKSSLKHSGRKQSFDPANFERMDMSQVNVLPYDQRPQNIPATMTNGYTITGSSQSYGFEPQYAKLQPQYSNVPMQPPPNPNGMNGNGIHIISTNGYSNGINGDASLEHVIESPLATPTTYGSGDSGKFLNGGPFGTPPVNSEVQAVSNGGSCCAPKQKSHSHTSSASSISDAEGPTQKSCCSSKAEPKFKQEPEANGGSAHATPHMAPQMLPQNGMNGVAFHPILYPQYGPQPTVFTYPATYGSFQNPLQPSAWRESVRLNNYSQVPLPPGPLPFDAPLVPETLDTVHTCSCGDGCQCIGCAAHPYNDASREYVWSAWASMNSDRPTSELYNNAQPPTNGTMASQPPPANNVASPTAQTPSSTTSGNEEEQTLSAADFFFVNYPFTSDGCGGDTQSCPCGDDCQCLGCTIHRQPAISCGGETESCPCGSDCQCIGCSIHGNGAAA
ncbi:hypothetical protein L207DRAFT_7780 [Hyaloscypha variabilis F]|uniref:Copper-fist domain-containing protein n=1 Tax=Hyaloscypha variabilis (strain UAMH 11265 / GT02V1 / F) TaxID=1149755 RepID=A0A2J6SCH9_HYAVF|nr:hypothetical protein L207DRAFT_7780 [Hyaloscypha variabilis F]